jgi:hypothetical protein
VNIACSALNIRNPRAHVPLTLVANQMCRVSRKERRSDYIVAQHGRARGFATRYTAAWSSQDAASVAAFVSPSGLLTINEGTPSLGRIAISKAVQGFMTAVPDLVDDLLEEHGKVIYKWTLEGTNSGPGATGRRVWISGFEQWRIGDDGLALNLLETMMMLSTSVRLTIE